MKVLVVGGGGREHSLVWKIGQSPRVTKLFCAPGNAGIAQMAGCIDISATDLDDLATFAERNGIDLTIVGPELPLTMGIVDLFEERGLRIFGPRKSAAEIEGSKVFCKDLLAKYGVPTAQYRTFDNRDQAAAYVESIGVPVVVKADGLAAGKGVIPSMTEEDALKALDTILVEKAFGDAGKRVVIEEFLVGEEASFIVLTDGETVVPLASSQDHKPIYDGDKGPNTGGMGAYSPAPVVTEGVHNKIMDEIMTPTIKALQRRIIRRVDDCKRPAKGIGIQCPIRGSGKPAHYDENEGGYRPPSGGVYRWKPPKWAHRLGSKVGGMCGDGFEGVSWKL